MRLDALPPRIESVAAPRYFSPSRFAHLQQCPLCVFCDANVMAGSLPPTAEMLFGTLLHHVREQLLSGRWGPATEAAEACDQGRSPP